MGRALARAMAEEPGREIVALAVVITAFARFAEGPALWVGAILAGLALALASLELLGNRDLPGVADLGVPVESLLVPSVAGIASVTAIGLVPVGLLLVPGLVAVGLIALASLDIERRLLARSEAPTAEDRTALMSLVVVLAFLAFTGIAAAIPGALVEPLTAGDAASGPGLALDNLALLAALDGLVAGIFGYRLAALQGPRPGSALWTALSYAAVIAIAAAALRAMGLPRLVGPALLTLVLYLWSAYRSVPRSARRNGRWVWEILLLAALGALVVAWNLASQG